MKIGELAAHSGLAPSAIRYYEDSGLLPRAARGANGYRDYPASAAERLCQIRIAQDLGFSLDTLRKVYASAEGLSPDVLIQGLDARLGEIAQLMSTLRTQRDELRKLRASVLASAA